MQLKEKKKNKTKQNKSVGCIGFKFRNFLK